VFGGTIDWKADYQYDAMNHRVASLYDDNGDGVTDRVERYVWDGDRIVLDFVDADGDNNSLGGGTESAPLTLATRYLWGPSVDQLLAQETVDNGGKEDVSYPVIDNLHSVRSLVNSDGDITATYSYDTYGNVSVITGSLSDTRFLYTCQEYDARLGLYYYNARWYDSTIGKFISEDTIGCRGGINLYEYCGDDPMTKTDPTGDWPFRKRRCCCPPETCPPEEPSPAPQPAPQPVPTPVPVPQPQPPTTCWGKCMAQQHAIYFSQLKTCIEYAGIAGAELSTLCFVGCLGTGPGYGVCVTTCLATAGIVTAGGGALCVAAYLTQMLGASIGCTLGCWWG